jgi:hypothetical protein
MVKYFQISKKNSIFSTSLGGMTKFFQIQKQKKFNSNFKNDFFKIFISKFSCGTNDFFSRPEVGKFIEKL